MQQVVWLGGDFIIFVYVFVPFQICEVVEDTMRLWLGQNYSKLQSQITKAADCNQMKIYIYLQLHAIKNSKWPKSGTNDTGEIFPIGAQQRQQFCLSNKSLQQNNTNKKKYLRNQRGQSQYRIACTNDNMR